MTKQARLENFPIMMFAIVMGMSGLSIAYEKAAHLFKFSTFIPNILVLLTTTIFVAIMAIYIIKFFIFGKEVKKEFSHPVRINFFAAVPISLLLLSVAYESVNTTVSVYFWWVGMFLQGYLTFHTISFWIILLTIIINRIIFHHQLANKFMPTLFIFIAPPAVGTIAYVKLTGHFDLFASFLFNIALFFTFLLFFMYKNFMKLEFFISWWAFTFPLTAVTIASILAYHKTGSMFCYYLAGVLLVISTIVVSFVAYKTIYHMFKKEICVIE